MATPTRANEPRSWTSGAVTVRRRRHRFIALSLVCGLLIAATAVTTAAAQGLVQLPGWDAFSGPAYVDAAPGVDQVGPVVSGPTDDVERPEDAAPAEPADDGGTPADTDAIDAAPGRESGSAPEPGSVRGEAPDVASPASEAAPEDEPAPTEGPARRDTPDGQDAEGSAAVEVVVVQERLRELGYLVGPADGVQGQQTIAAVMAFQRVNDLQVDGVVGPQTIAALEAPAREPVLRGGPADRVEVDLDRQILHLVEGGERVVTLKVSSGNGAPYRTASGGTALARTPVGEFVIERRIHGVREARLGTLYDPLYFHHGFAVHGSLSVPSGPASSGCVRIARADAAWLIWQVPDGTAVHLYGGTHVFVPSA